MSTEQQPGKCGFLAAVEKFVNAHNIGGPVTKASLNALGAWGIPERSGVNATRRSIRCAATCSGALALRLENDQLMEMGWTGSCADARRAAEEAARFAAQNAPPPEPTLGS